MGAEIDIPEHLQSVLAGFQLNSRLDSHFVKDDSSFFLGGSAVTFLAHPVNHILVYSRFFVYTIFLELQ